MNVANWTNGLPASGNNGQISVNGTFSTGAVSAFSLSTVTVSDGATLSKADSGKLSFGNDLILYISSGTLSTIGEAAFYRSCFVLEDGNITASIITLAGSNKYNQSTVSGGTIMAGRIQLNGGVAKELVFTGGNTNLTASNGLYFLGSGGCFTFAAGESGSVTTTGILWGSGTESTSYINFEAGSAITLTVNGYTEETFETLWANSKLRFNDVNEGAFSDYFQVTGSTLSLVPEPANAGMITCVFAVTLLVARRRNSKPAL